MRVEMLGAARVLLDDGEADHVDLRPTVRDQALAYLAYRSEWVSRDRLAFLFWPDEPDATARHNVRQLLKRMRRLSWAGSLEVADDNVRWCVTSDVEDGGGRGGGGGGGRRGGGEGGGGGGRGGGGGGRGGGGGEGRGGGAAADDDRVRVLAGLTLGWARKWTDGDGAQYEVTRQLLPIAEALHDDAVIADVFTVLGCSAPALEECRDHLRAGVAAEQANRPLLQGTCMHNLGCVLWGLETPRRR